MRTTRQFLFLIGVFSPLILAAEVRAPKPACNAVALLNSAKIEEIKPSTQERSPAEIETLFARVKRDLIFDIGKNKAVSARSLAQRTMIARIESVALSLKTCPPAANKKSSPSLKANYSLIENVVSVCDSARTAPEIALVGIFGHELGHSIDLVNLGCRTFRIRNAPQKLESLISKKSTAPSADVESLRESLATISSTNRTFNACAFQSEFEKQELEKLRRLGKIEIVDEGSDPERHPLNSAYACFAKNYGWASLPKNQVEAMAGGYGKYGENSADIYGARAIALYTQSKKVSPAEALGALEFFQIYPASSAKRSRKERAFDSIYLSEPALQQAISCEADSKQTCSRFLTFESVERSSSRPSGQGSQRSAD